MKNVFVLFFLLIFSLAIKAQTLSEPPQISPYGIMDTVHDTHGNRYKLSELQISQNKLYNHSSVNALSSYSCSAGYFDLYFAANSYFDGSGSPQSDRRAVLCQVFTDVSNFITSPLAVGGNTVRISIYCDNVSGGSNALATAGGILVNLSGAANPNQGIVHTQIQKAIISGLDPYANLPINLFGTTGFYSGVVNTSSNPTTGTFNYAMNNTTISATEIDYYTVMLHEVFHALGVGSLIGSNGISILGPNNNVFSLYDLYLKNSSGTPLLSTSTPSCSNSNLSATSATPFINPSNCTPTVDIDVSTCSTVCQYSSTNVQLSVFTPSCFVDVTSLSHFEDYCSIGSGTSAVSAACYTNNGNSYNNLYYVMSNKQGYGSCYIKRYPKPKERLVLCDLGYSVKNTYSSSSPSAAIDGTASTYSYSGGNCSGTNIWGVHDGLGGNSYTITTSGTSTSIPIVTLLSNDSPTTAVGVSCVEIIYTNSITNATAYISGSNVVVNAMQGSGLQVFKYLPTNSSGEFGNVTYVYVYFLSVGCTPPDPCNMVQNGGFENVLSGATYGTLTNILNPGGPKLNCWSNHLQTPDLYTRGSTGSMFDLGVNTESLLPVVDSYTGTPNDHILGSIYVPGPSPNGLTESFINSLGAPLVPGNSYQVSMWVYNHSGTKNGNVLVNPNMNPLIVTVASASTTALFSTSFPGGLDVLKQFTINACNVWTPITATFVFSPSVSVNHNALIIGVNHQSMTVYPSSTLFYCFFDDIQLLPLPGGSFSLPAAVPCGNSTFTNLAQYTSTFSPGVFSGTGVTYTNSMYHFNASGTLSPGNYPIGFTYTNGAGCPITLWQNVFIINSLSLSPTSFSYCSNLTPSVALTVTPNPLVSGINYTWQPGSLSGISPTVHPVVNTVYTVSATSGSCSANTTLAVNVSSTCCPPSAYPSFTSATVSSTTFASSLVFLNSFTVQTGHSVSFSSSEFLFAPSAKITVNGSGTHLFIKGSHLYGCSGEMWQGIEVLDGADVSFIQENGKDNLIEDAITAVDISNHVTTTQTVGILEALNTTFNKNYIDINISNYTKTLTAYPFKIKNCVFTCRDLSSAINATAWPSTGTSSSVSGVGAQLRTTINPTTGLSSPFINPNFAVATLKNPYSNQSSKIAIQVTTVGITTATNMYGVDIGDDANANEYNLFDAHGFYVFGINSNIKLRNNIFQNTTGDAILHPDIGGGQVKIPSAAVRGYVSSTFNVKLDMIASSYVTGNRFWNCHRSVVGTNIYFAEIAYSIFRSTQNSTVTGVQQGNLGLHLGSNRFNYFIHNNEFTNIANGINVGISTGTYAVFSTTSSTSGTYAGRIYINYNTLSSGTITNAFMDNAITISSSLANTVTVPSNTVYPFLFGMIIDHNVLTNVYKGIALNGNGALYPTTINTNTISIVNDIINSTTQYGINVNNTLGKNSVSENLVSAQTTTNTLQSLFLFTNNQGAYSPSVSCNTATNCNKGFQFLGANGTPTLPLITLWRGNEMKTLSKGMVIKNGGIIGPQGNSGSPNSPMDNTWTGSWSGNNGIYADTSDATYSPLTYKTGTGVFTPTNPGGVGPNISGYYGALSTTYNVSSGSYNCGDHSASRTVTKSLVFETTTQLFSYKDGLYRYLHFNDSIRGTNGGFTSFYGDHGDSSMATFVDIEQELYDGDFAEAATLISAFTPGNDAETNYKLFYTLYKKYAENNFEFTDIDDSTDLHDLANGCTKTNGPPVNKARALYNLVFKNSYNYINNCAASKPLKPLGQYSENKNLNVQDWYVKIYPNPANDRISIETNTKTGEVTIEIADLTGRRVLTKQIKILDFFITLEIDLFNGVYLLTLINNENRTATKKLVIAK